MSFTNCCNHRFIGDNHSPIQPDGYCLHCGFHPEIEKLKKENDELRKDLLYFWTWIVGGYESRPETGLRNELDIMEEKYPWLRCEIREPPMFNLSETPNSSKDGV